MPAPKRESKHYSRLPAGSCARLTVSGGMDGALTKGKKYTISEDRDGIDDWQVKVIGPGGLYTLDTYCLEVVEEAQQVDA